MGSTIANVVCAGVPFVNMPATTYPGVTADGAPEVTTIASDIDGASCGTQIWTQSQAERAQQVTVDMNQIDSLSGRSLAIAGLDWGGDHDVIALAAAFENATEVDPATGLMEIRQGQAGALAQALYAFATGSSGAIADASTTDQLLADGSPFSAACVGVQSPAGVVMSRTAAVSDHGDTSQAVVAADIEAQVAAAACGSAASGFSFVLSESVSSVVSVQTPLGNMTDDYGVAAITAMTEMISVSATGEVTVTNVAQSRGADVIDTMGAGGSPGNADILTGPGSEAVLGGSRFQTTQVSVDALTPGVTIVNASALSLDSTITAAVGARQGGDSGLAAGVAAWQTIAAALPTGSRRHDDSESWLRSRTGAYELANQLLRQGRWPQSHRGLDRRGAADPHTFGNRTSAITLSVPSLVKGADGRTTVLYVRPDGGYGRFGVTPIDTIA